MSSSADLKLTERSPFASIFSQHPFHFSPSQTKNLENFPTDPSNLHPQFGSTIFVAKTQLDTNFGPFDSYLFQDIISKAYVVALAKGDIFKTKRLFTRCHSSCITSETLRGMDCDCVSQLEEAFFRISQSDAGILFYLLQEGRGAGYVIKSRGCMLVQYAEDKIGSFDAYSILGLKNDYRSYHSVRDICKILKIDPEFILMTNNPSKKAGMIEVGMKIHSTQNIESEPSFFNNAYLKTKKESGHVLKKVHEDEDDTSVSKPPFLVEPFQPLTLPGNLQRCIYVSAYYLPVKMVDDVVCATLEQIELFLGVKTKPIENSPNSCTNLLSLLKTTCPYIDSVSTSKSKNEAGNINFLLQINWPKLESFRLEHPNDLAARNITAIPYWFRVHVYWDLVKSEERVILTFGKLSRTLEEISPLKENEKIDPIVRISSESIFNRFPLKKKDNRSKYKQALKLIVQNGSGIIVFIAEDGRGNGLAIHTLVKSMKEASLNQNNAEKLLGVESDSRDYDFTCNLIKSHLPPNQTQIQVALNSTQKKTLYQTCFQKVGLEIKNWIKIEIPISLQNSGSVPSISSLSESLKKSLQDVRKSANFDDPDPLGHFILANRLIQNQKLVSEMLLNPIQLKKDYLLLNNNKKHFVVTGTGSSEAHSKYLVFLLNQFTNEKFTAEFRPLSDFLKLGDPKETFQSCLIVISQGISPNAQIAIQHRHKYNHFFLFTSSTIKGCLELQKEKAAKILVDLEKEENSEIVWFPIENEYQVLIRFIGPLLGYIACMQFVKSLAGKFCSIPIVEDNLLLDSLFEKSKEKAQLFASNLAIENNRSTLISILSQNVAFVSCSPFPQFISNLAYKFLEGLYTPLPSAIDYLHFAHGPFQQMIASRKGLFIILHSKKNQEEEFLVKRLEKMVIEGLEKTSLKTHKTLTFEDGYMREGVMIKKIESDLPLTHRILEFEMILNHFLLIAIKLLNVDQKNFPGKELAEPLYGISEIIKLN